MKVPKIDPTEFDQLEDYVQAALVCATLAPGNPQEVGRRATAAALHAYAALRDAAAMAALAKPGNKEWKADAKAVEAVEYLLSIGFNYEDFLLADIEENG